MNCQEYRREIIDMAAGEPGANTEGSRAHLAGCDACRRELDEITRLMDGAGRALSALQAPPLELSRVRLRHAGKSVHRWLVPGWATAAGIFIAALSGALLGYMGAHTGRDNPHSRQQVRLAETKSDFWTVRTDSAELLRMLALQDRMRQGDLPDSHSDKP